MQLILCKTILRIVGKEVPDPGEECPHPSHGQRYSEPSSYLNTSVRSGFKKKPKKQNPKNNNIKMTRSGCPRSRSKPWTGGWRWGGGGGIISIWIEVNEVIQRVCRVKKRLVTEPESCISGCPSLVQWSQNNTPEEPWSVPPNTKESLQDLRERWH